MPDTRVERMAGDSLEPTTEFIMTGRQRIVGEWRGEEPPPAPDVERPRRVWWLAAAAVGGVVAAAAWFGAQSTPQAAEPPASTTPTTTIPAGPVPESAVGRLWVVTVVDGAPWPHPVLPTFTFAADGTVTGFDGCNDYAIDENGSTTPGLPCEGIASVAAEGPYDFSETSDDQMATVRFRAEIFGRNNDPAGTPTVIGSRRFANVGSVTLNDDDTMTISGGGCEGAVSGTYTFVDGVLQFQIDVPDCAVPDTGFRQWLQQMTATGGRVAFNNGPVGGLWIDIAGHVTRLTDQAPAIEHPVGDDTTPDAAGLRVADWNGGFLASVGFVLDETHLGVLVDGSLVSATADGQRLLIIGTDGVLRPTVPVSAEFSRLAVRPGHIAALIGDGVETRISLDSATLGDVAEPAVPVTVSGPNPDCTYEVVLGERRWIVDQKDCNTALLEPVALDNGSVIALVQDTIALDPGTEADDIVELSAIRLNTDGTQQRTALGRHPVDDAKGWVTVQATESGGFVVFHYSDDAVVLYRYLFVPEPSE